MPRGIRRPYRSDRSGRFSDVRDFPGLSIDREVVALLNYAARDFNVGVSVFTLAFASRALLDLELTASC